MKLNSICGVCAFVMLSVFSASAEDVIKRNGNPDIVVPKRDQSMSQAIQKARASLDLFFEKQDEIGDHFGEFSLKVGLPTNSGGVEHIWIVNPRETEDGLTGYLNNEPFDVTGDARYKDKVEFTRNDVIDWAYFENDKYYGHFTTRIIVQKYDVATVANFMSGMHDAPLPQS